MKTFEQELTYFGQFTQVYIANLRMPKAIREARCLAVQYPFMLSDIESDDLFAGRFEYPVVYFVPQTYSGKGGVGFGYVFDELRFDALISSPGISCQQMDVMESLATFWKKENTAGKCRPQLSADLARALPEDAWVTESGVAFPLYRMAGSQLDYDKLMQLGIPGLRRLVQSKARDNGDPQHFYEASLLVIDTLADACLYYSRMANYKTNECTGSSREKHLRRLSAALENIASNKPGNLFEAIQLYFLYNTLAGSMNFGRIDEALGDFLANDLGSGHLSPEEAQALVTGLWRLMASRKTIFDGRPIIGGRGRRNETNANRFALMAMEATRQTRDVLPQLSLRFYKGQDPALYAKALDVLGEGNTFPMLYNDDVNIPAVAKSFGVSLSEAEAYTPYGCGEFVLYHRSYGTPNGLLNLTKVLETVLNRGVDPWTGKAWGEDCGPVEAMDSFKQLWGAYSRQVDFFMHHLALQQELTYDIAAQEASFLYLSLLYDDCLERGKPIFEGGIRYLGGTIETYGNTNTADALLAIKKVVFEQRTIGLDGLVKALNANFRGYDSLRRALIACPKYGNDQPEADAMMAQVHEQVCQSARAAGQNTRMDSYLLVNINNHANTLLGHTTCASADGRLAGQPLANANNPSGGNDKQGLTAMLNSLVRLRTDIHAGTVQNIKFSSDLFNRHRPKVEALLAAYFSQGGSQAMPTIVNRGELEEAFDTPEKYPNLMVRVGGFSARFVELDRDVQREILSRTIY